MNEFEEMSQSSEKRTFKRLQYSEPIRFEFTDPSRFGGCVSCDISEGGLKIRFPEFLPVETELKMTITLPERVVECMGKVVWVRKLPFVDQYELGLEFEELDSIIESRSRIQKFMQDR